MSTTEAYCSYFYRDQPLPEEVEIKVEEALPKILDPAPNQKLITKINKVLWLILGCWSAYSLFDAGLSRLFALETLNHGTGPLGYIGISLNGADPNFGGGHTGSSAGVGDADYIRNSQRQFHVFKDTAFTEFCEWDDLKTLCITLGNHILPRMHAVFSGMANFGYSRVYMTGGLGNAVIGAISGLFTPTLNFRFKPEDVLNCTSACFFENDPDYSNAAYRTTMPISATRLGIIGSLTQGIDANMLSRMCASPWKVVLGVALIGTAALVARKTYQYYVKSTPVEKVNPSATFYQNFKRRVKSITVNSCWTTAAVTLIFLNTL